MANDLSPDPRNWSDAWLAEQHRAAVMAAADLRDAVGLAEITAEVTRRHNERQALGTTPETRHHLASCRRVFARFDPTCPRCQALAKGAIPRRGWSHGTYAERQAAQRRAAQRAKAHAEAVANAERYSIVRLSLSETAP